MAEQIFLNKGHKLNDTFLIISGHRWLPQADEWMNSLKKHLGSINSKVGQMTKILNSCMNQKSIYGEEQSRKMFEHKSMNISSKSLKELETEQVQYEQNIKWIQVFVCELSFYLLVHSNLVSILTLVSINVVLVIILFSLLKRWFILILIC